MVVELLPVKGGRDYIIPQLAGKIHHLYTTYSPCLLGGYMLPNHLLGEPETTIVMVQFSLPGSFRSSQWPVDG